MDSLQAFTQLKALLLSQYQEAYPYYRGGLQEFRQQDILNFQQLLEERVQARVSEKWFYTHLKADINEKLPRIDTLNLLARFVGYDSWDAFCHKLEKASPSFRYQNLISKAWLILLLPVAWALWMGLSNKNGPDQQICFVDAIRQTAINEQVVQATLYQTGHAPLQLKSDDQGCLLLPKVTAGAMLIVNTPYYLPDTLLLTGNERLEESLKMALQSDDYALMIHYFSNSKVTDWKRRRAQLETVFAEDAMIYQIDPNGQLGMDILNKSEFINKLTIPINSLRNVEVLQTRYDAGQVVELRFRVKE